MQHQIVDRPDFAVIQMRFDQAGESVIGRERRDGRAGHGHRDEELDPGRPSGARSSARCSGGESLFQNTFTATQPGQQIWFAPGPEGDIVHLEMDGQHEVMLNSGAFLATVPSVTLDTKWGGREGLLQRHRLLLAQMLGTRAALLQRVRRDPRRGRRAEGYIVDTDHVVGFTTGLSYNVTKLGGLKRPLPLGRGARVSLQRAGAACGSARARRVRSRNSCIRLGGCRAATERASGANGRGAEAPPVRARLWDAAAGCYRGRMVRISTSPVSARPPGPSRSRS